MVNWFILKKNLYQSILLFPVLITIFYVSQIFAGSFSSPTLSSPTAPGKFGARELDWSASDNGDLNYNIPIQTPKLRQLDIGLSVNYSPENSYSEAGAFWGFNLPKVILDTKRGNTKYISKNNCQNSLANNLYVNGLRMIPIGNGSWASTLNSSRDLLRCDGNGFVYHKSNGEIFHFGSSQDSQVADATGNALEWYLTKHSTFQGSQEILYHYERPVINSASIGIQSVKLTQNTPEDFNLISKPLLKTITADDILVQISYENNEFYNTHFNGGFPQLIAGRVNQIIIQKNNTKIRSYKFEYELNTNTPFPRLRSVQEFGSDGVTAFPKTIFSYRVENFSFNNNMNNVNKYVDYSFLPLGYDKSRFADVFGTGKSQIITQEFSNSLLVQSYEPESIFPKDGSPGKLKLLSKKKLIGNQMNIKLQNSTFVDFLATGAMDIFYVNDGNNSAPWIILNDRKINAEGNIVLDRIVNISFTDHHFSACAGVKSNYKFGNFSGSGRTDIFCIKNGELKFLFNKGIKELNLVGSKKFELDAERFSVKLTDRLINADHIEVVDWNSDGLPDILQLYNGRMHLFVNNGRLANGERTGKFFEKIELGNFGDQLLRYKLKDFAIGDFTGTGLPSINYGWQKFLINNGLGKPLTQVIFDRNSLFKPAYTAVTQFTGDGKHQIVADSPGYGNTIMEFPVRSFPNHLHSITTSDGRYLSFNYTSSVLENNEAIQYDNDEEIKGIERNVPLMPVVIPLLKQVGLSDGFNPTRMWRYAYRVPNFDRTYKKFLGFSLVRKQTVGDNTQSGTLTEKRFLSGYRISESEKMGRIEDIRLSTEKSIFSQGETSQCLNPAVTAIANQWCNDLSGYNYYSRSGAALNNISFATGSLNTQENYTSIQSSLSLKFLNLNHLPGNGVLDTNKFEIAQILENRKSITTSGDKFLNYSNISKTESYHYDEQGRLITKIQNNSPVLNGDNLVTSYTYFCPLSHQVNQKIYCDNIEMVQTSSSLGSVKTTIQKFIYNNLTGLPIEEWSSNQNGELVLQASASYDAYGRIKSLINATGIKSSFEWEETNVNLKSIVDQDNIKTLASYNEFGQISQIENTRGSISQFTYDVFGRVLMIAKNLGGNAPLDISNDPKSTWEIFINWLKSVFDLSKSNSENSDNFHTSFKNITNNNIIPFEKYEYFFPKIELANGKTLDEEINVWNKFDATLELNPRPEIYNETSIGKIQNAKMIPGSVTVFRRNQEKENLTLVSKIWLSGADEVLFSANRIDNNRFTISNKSTINSLGKSYKEYLNSEMSLDDVVKNNLPDSSLFKIKSISSFYADGAIASHEFDTNVIQRFLKGVDFEESISPEGRRTKNIYNQIGQISTKYIGLDSNGNSSQDTLETKLEYDALGRLIKVTNNDNLIAWQSYASNNLVEKQSNNALGNSRFYYDNFGRLIQTALCPLGSDIENCNMLDSSILYKSYAYNAKGKLEKEEHIRFNRENNTHAKETISFTYGSLERNNRSQDIALPINVSVSSLNDLGSSQSIRKYAYNKEGLAASEDLELFLNKKSLGVYQLERITDLSGNLVQLRSRGGFQREVLNKLKDNYFTGYSAKYEDGTSLINSVSFLHNGIAQSVPLQKVNYDAQGYTKKIELENNLQLQSCWHKRKEVPLAFWAGNKNLAPAELCEESENNVNSLAHTRWTYDNDLFPISTRDLSGNKVLNASLSTNSLFTYDSQGRLSSTRGMGDENQSWGNIFYHYSVGGKINKVVRSGNFIKDRISKNAQSLIDTYSYSATGQIGVLQKVNSTDGNEFADLTFANDEIGFRKFGVAPTLAVFQSENSNRNIQDKSSSTHFASSWKDQSEIPMQKYVWNGRGQLAGVFAGVLNNNKELETNELLNFRMSDENGGQLAEFDGVTYQKLLNDGRQPQDNSEKKNDLTIQKLPRSVAFAQGITFERDEIHFNIGIGSFANLRLITRYPTLNAKDAVSLSSSNMQSRKELVIKDHVGSVSQVIDIDSHKIVERNASEPFGLGRGIPLLTNSTLSSYKNFGNRKDVSLYTNVQSNMRDNWEGKSFEILGSSNSNELQGMRGTEVFAKGKFSASTGLHSMGVRAYDPARGLWMSPDIYIGQNFDEIIKVTDEANLFQYAGNNPIEHLDPSGKGKVKVIKDLIKTGDITAAAYGMAEGINRRVNDAFNSDASVLTRVYSAGCVALEIASPVGCDEIDVAAELINSALSSNITTVATPAVNLQNITSTAAQAEVSKAKSTKAAPIHHIATDKNLVHKKGAGPWTPRFKELFDKFDLKMNSEVNKVSVPGHVGGHPPEYHLNVYDRLTKATKNLEGETGKQALINELSKIALDINTKGSLMNDMVTKQGDFVSKSTKDSSRSSVASGKGSSISNERRNDNRTKN